MADPLSAYNRKRDFTKTEEPRGTFDTLTGSSLAR